MGGDLHGHEITHHHRKTLWTYHTIIIYFIVTFTYSVIANQMKDSSSQLFYVGQVVYIIKILSKLF